MHELEIVDDDHVDVVAHLRLPRLQHQGQFVHHRRVIDVDRRFSERSERIGNSVKFRFG